MHNKHDSSSEGFIVEQEESTELSLRLSQVQNLEQIKTQLTVFKIILRYCSLFVFHLQHSSFNDIKNTVGSRVTKFRIKSTSYIVVT